MKKTALTLAIAALAATPGLVHAQDYQMEGRINYANINPNTAGADSSDAFGLEALYYFDPVRTAGHPLAEAAFIERANNAFVSYNYVDATPYPNLFRVGTEFYQEDFYGALSVHHTEGSDVSESGIGLVGGFLPMETLRLTLGYSFEDPFYFGNDVISVGAKYLQELQGGSFFHVTGHVDLVDDDPDTTVYDLRGDYFLDRTLSVGLGLTHVDNDFDDTTAVTVGAEKFFTPMLSASIDFTMDAARENDPSSDSDILAFGVSARF